MTAFRVSLVLPSGTEKAFTLSSREEAELMSSVARKAGLDVLSVSPEATYHHVSHAMADLRSMLERRI